MKRLDYIYITLLGLLALTAGCTDDFEPQQAPDRLLLPGEYYFVLSSDDAGSRVAYPDEVSSTFETGDQIGVFASNSEKQIQNDVFAARPLNSDTPIQVLAPPKGNITQELDTEIPKPGASEPQYYFYFPMNKSWKLSDITIGTGFSYSVEADQTTKENFQKSDFLWNYLVPKPDAPYQEVHMHHLMATIVVKVHKDSIDVSDGKGVTLRKMHLTAKGVTLAVSAGSDVPKVSNEPGNMNYGVNTQSASDISDIKMYCQGESGEYLVYRAAVPAWNTLEKDKEIFTLNLFDRNGKAVETTYKLDAALSLRDGYYYTFTLRSAVKPAIPDVSDDDSWVLDVFDPETNEVVGMLCREYVRYQPGVGRTEAEYITGTPYNDTKYVLSQAWVFYNLKEGYESQKIVNLDKGTVLRFIYDLRTSNKEYTNYPCTGIWPLPHIATTGGGGGMFAVAHGHVWGYNTQDYTWSVTASGCSTKLYQWNNDQYVENGHDDAATGELYMHGGTITWEKTSGVHPFKNEENLEYYHIAAFTMPEIKVTNHDALQYGHIAIDADNNVSVSYKPYDDITKRELDDNTVKVGRTEPHKLNDHRGIEYMAYPIVKIGYNNFWMSKSLHTKCLNDGTPLTDHYNTINHETVSFDKVEKTDEYDQTYEEYPELEKGFLYPYIKSADGIIFDSRKSSKADEYPLLYNYVAFSDEQFLPIDASVDIPGLNRFNVKIPDDEEIGAILNYFGIAYASKLMSSAFRPAVENSYNKVYDLQQALLNKCYTDEGYNFYVANVSGFNLHAMGGFSNNKFDKDLGRQLSMWLLLPEDERYNDAEKTNLNLALLRFDNYSAFSGSGNLTEIIHKIPQMPSGDFSRIPIRHQIFYPVRYFMRMKYQQNSSGTTNAVKSVLRKSSKPYNNTTSNPSKIIPVAVNKSITLK